MPVFVWEGRTRTGELKKGKMEAEAEPRAEPPPRAGHHAVQGEEEGQGSRAQAALRRRRRREGHRRLHAAVRHHDRRRPAHRAVPRHPRRAGGEQALSARCSTTVKAARRVGRHAVGGDAQAAQGLRRALRQPGRGRRGRRHPGHHSAASRALHREGDEAEVAGQGRDGLPHLVLFVALGVVDPAPVEGHPRLRKHVQGFRRRRAAQADAVRHQPVQRVRRPRRS